MLDFPFDSNQNHFFIKFLGFEEIWILHENELTCKYKFIYNFFVSESHNNLKKYTSLENVVLSFKHRFYFSGLFLPVVRSAKNRFLFKIIAIVSLVIRKIRSRAKTIMETPDSRFRRQEIEKSILKCFYWFYLHLLYQKCKEPYFTLEYRSTWFLA